MVATNPQFKMISSVSELPDPRSINDLFADTETISWNSRRGGNKPYLGDRAVGWGICVDDNPTGFYVPLRHQEIPDSMFAQGYPNVDIGQFRGWMNEAMKHSRWINHGIKFDAHFCNVDGIEPSQQMIDTLTLCKVVDGQRPKQDYGLKPITKLWLGEDQDDRDAVNDELRRLRTRDFGGVDAGIMGPYAADDTLRNRRLWHEINRRRYAGDEMVWGIETECTRALYDMETQPVYIDQERLSNYKTQFCSEMDALDIEVENLGISVNMRSAAEVNRYVLDDLGLPVVEWTTGTHPKPSMSGAAIEAYLVHDRVRDDAKLVRFFEILLQYREKSQFVSLYANGWEKWMDSSGAIHPFYNQTVATGRMSCTNPNLQQLNALAKTCIIPGTGMSFLSRDYSQVEYRVIASVCKDHRMIGAYRDNPDTDFHQFVAELCGIDRNPAKSVNFGIAFSMGLSGLIAQLRASLGDVSEAEAQAVLDGYNREFPRVRGTSNAIVARARSRTVINGLDPFNRNNLVDGGWGFINTLYGRRRNLQYHKYREAARERKKFSDDTRLAFNSVIQGTAADLMKEAFVRISKDEMLRNAGVVVVGIVHDEFLFRGPTREINNPLIQQRIDLLMCSPGIDLGLPLMVSGGQSSETWKAAG